MDIFGENLIDMPTALPGNHKRSIVPNGRAGTAETIKRMISLAQHGKRDMRVRKAILQAIADCPQKDFYCYAQGIHNFVNHKIKYAYDPVSVELVESPHHILEAGIADCDSKCILFASMCENIGLPVRFVTVKSSELSDEYSHVFSQVKVKGKWIGSDCTMPGKPFGWEPPLTMPRAYWPVTPGAEEADDNMGFLGKPKSFRGKRRSKRMSGLGCNGDVMCAKCADKNGLSGMGFLGLSVGDAAQTISDVLSGDYASELSSARRRAFENKSYVDGIVIAAQRDGNSEILQPALTAQNAALKTLQAVQSTIVQYTDLVRLLKTLGLADPPQLAGLRALPIAVIAAGAGVSVAAIALAGAWAHAQTLETASGNYIKNLTGLVATMSKAGVSASTITDYISKTPPPSTSSFGILDSIGTVALIGGIGVAAYFLFMRRGGIF